MLDAACGLVKVFVRCITWTVPRRQSIKEAEALLQNLRPVASKWHAAARITIGFLVDLCDGCVTTVTESNCSTEVGTLRFSEDERPLK